MGYRCIKLIVTSYPLTSLQVFLILITILIYDNNDYHLETVRYLELFYTQLLLARFL